jgi:stearoyl-CoA desaturase (delta-9 desaturase)
VCAAELDKLKAQGAENTQHWAQMRLAQRWLHRDDDKIPADVKLEVAQARAQSPALDKLVAMREELRQLWTRSNVSAEQLVIDLQAWCHKAEQSGITTLQQFSVQLRAVRV